MTSIIIRVIDLVKPGPEQPTLYDPALSRGDGLGDLCKSLPASKNLWLGHFLSKLSASSRVLLSHTES